MGNSLGLLSVLGINREVIRSDQTEWTFSKQGEEATMQRIPMLRDDAGKGGGGRRNEPRNALGDRLEVCSLSHPSRGYAREPRPLT